MRKLIQGIIDFKQNISPEQKETFARLALGQSPDALFVCCSDSRVAPNLFASTDPGDLFVIRNMGNLIPPCLTAHSSENSCCQSAAAAIEFSVLHLQVSSIVICGHSECGAMQSIIQNCSNVTSPNLLGWLAHGQPALQKMNQTLHQKKKNLLPHNYLSQLNVLEQIKHLHSYKVIQDRVAQKKLKIYGWWFDIATTNLYSYNEVINDFVIFDNSEAQRLLLSMDK